MTNRLLTPEQVTEPLQVTERTDCRWLAQGHPAGVELGWLWRTRPEALEAFLQAHQLRQGGQTVDEVPATSSEAFSHEDRTWLDAGAGDLGRTLEEVEKELLDEELADYLGPFDSG